MAAPMLSRTSAAAAPRRFTRAPEPKVAGGPWPCVLCGTPAFGWTCPAHLERLGR